MRVAFLFFHLPLTPENVLSAKAGLSPALHYRLSMWVTLLSLPLINRDSWPCDFEVCGLCEGSESLVWNGQVSDV